MLGWAIAVSARAAHPLETEDTATQGRGNVELENGFSRDRAAGVTALGYQLQVSWGLAPTLDLLVQPSWVLQRLGSEPAVRGLGDTNLDFKWRFHGAAPYSLALRAGLALATSEHDLGLPRGTVASHATLVATLDAEPWTLHANAGLDHNPRSAGLRKDVPRLSLATQWAMSESLTLSAEVGTAEIDDPTRSTWRTGVLAGAVLTLRPGLDLDFGLRRALRPTQSGREVLLGLTWRFAP
jgi:hypothetical protein